MLDCLIITSTSVRHKYFSFKILKSIPNSGVIFENRDRISYYNIKYEDIMKDHFDGLFNSEKEYFSKIVKDEFHFLESKTLGVINKDDINTENFI